MPGRVPSSKEIDGSRGDATRTIVYTGLEGVRSAGIERRSLDDREGGGGLGMLGGPAHSVFKPEATIRGNKREGGKVKL